MDASECASCSNSEETESRNLNRIEIVIAYVSLCVLLIKFMDSIRISCAALVTHIHYILASASAFLSDHSEICGIFRCLR